MSTALQSLGGSLRNVVAVASGDGVGDSLAHLGGSLKDVLSSTELVLDDTVSKTASSIRRMLRRRSLSETDLTTLLPPDFEWEEVGSAKPSYGVEISNDKLSHALARGADVTKEDLAQFGVASVAFGSFVRVGERYFMIRPKTNSCAEEVQGSTLSEADSDDPDEEAGVVIAPPTTTQEPQSQSPQAQIRPDPGAFHRDWYLASVEARKNHHAFMTAFNRVASGDRHNPDLERARFWSSRRKSQAIAQQELPWDLPVSDAIAALKRQLKEVKGKSMPNVRAQNPVSQSPKPHQNKHRQHNRPHESHKPDASYAYAEAAMVSAQANRIHLREMARIDNAISAEHARCVAEDVDGPARRPPRTGRRRSMSETDLPAKLLAAEAQLGKISVLPRG
jgi:hypothetical protein